MISNSKNTFEQIIWQEVFAIHSIDSIVEMKKIDCDSPIGGLFYT